MSTVTLASVSFQPFHADRRLYGKLYEMQPWERGKDPVFLRIENAIQREQGPYVASGVSGRRSVNVYTIYAEDIARDLINEWTRTGLGQTPDCHPGIWRVRDTILLFGPDLQPIKDAEGRVQSRPATPEEYETFFSEDQAAALAADAEYAKMLVAQKDSVEDMGPTDARRVGHNFANAIRAAKHYGYQRSDSWFGTARTTDNKPCPYCQALNPPQMIKCQTCKEIVDPERYAMLKAKEEQALAKFGMAVADAPTPKKPN